MNNIRPFLPACSKVMYMYSVEPSTLEVFLDSPETAQHTLKKWLVEDEFGKAFYLDKSWEGMHYLLNKGCMQQKASPLCWAIRGRKSLTQGITGSFESAAYLHPKEVAKVSASLQALTKEDLSSYFNPEKMNAGEIAPGDWDQHPGLRLKYLLTYFSGLKIFFRHATYLNRAVIHCLTLHQPPQFI